MGTMDALLAHGGESVPAGGAPLEDAIAATAVAAVAVAAVVALGWAHRTGRTAVLARLAGFSERVSDLPGWAALPSAIAGGALLAAVFGFYWDVALHIDIGRDPGPFANTAHWWIIVGLAGIALGGVVSVIMGSDPPPRSAVRLGEGWHVPVGGLLLALTGGIALLGFPFDDVWHRLFGQDVTLWSPTHIQMVGGASLSTLAIWVLLVEGRRASRPRSKERTWRRVRAALVAGAFLVGMSTLQAEFDYAVPQFRLLYHPVLIALAAGLALVPARMRLGRGGALAATAVFLAIRGALSLLVGGAFDLVALRFPLYLGAAAAVELVALVVPPRRQVPFGLWSGVAVGTGGLAVEWAWTQFAMDVPWTAALLPEVLLALPAAVAGAILGGAIGGALAPAGEEGESTPGWVAGLAGAVAVAAIAYPSWTTGAPGARAEIALEEVAAGEERAVHATITTEPRDLAEGAEWFTVTAWQGAGGEQATSFVDHLERVDEGVYRTTRPVPVHGGWKASVRLHKGRVLAAAPIYMPEDPAIPAAEVPAEDRMTRDFVVDRLLLQREAKEVPAWLGATANLVLFAVLALWIAAFTWGLGRIDLSRREDRESSGQHAARVHDPVGRRLP